MVGFLLRVCYVNAGMVTKTPFTKGPFNMVVGIMDLMACQAIILDLKQPIIQVNHQILLMNPHQKIIRKKQLMAKRVQLPKKLTILAKN